MMFTGHRHQWKISTRTQTLVWNGETPLRLEPPERYLVVIAAVCDGWCATYDTKTCELTPIRLRE